MHRGKPVAAQDQKAFVIDSHEIRDGNAQDSIGRTSRESLSSSQRKGLAEPFCGDPMTETGRLKAKICLVGEGAVGKTSLIRRFVADQFDDDYITTLGAKVTKKEVEVSLRNKDSSVRLEMTVWDVMGQPKFREMLKDVYFQGAAGILAVADLTRRETLDALYEWVDRVDRVTSQAPVVLAVNKADLSGDARFGETEAARLAKAVQGEFLMTSAKTGANVEAAFRRLGAIVVQRLLEGE